MRQELPSEPTGDIDGEPPCAQNTLGNWVNADKRRRGEGNGRAG